MKALRSFCQAMLLALCPPIEIVAFAYTSMSTLVQPSLTMQKAAPNNSIPSGSVRSTLVVSTNPLISRSTFVLTASVAALMTPLAAIAGPVDQGEVASFSSAAFRRVQKSGIVQQTSPSQVSAQPGPSSLQESISGFVAGGALAAAKTLVKYPLDTATVRLQVPDSGYSVSELSRLFSGSYNGVTFSLLSNIPAGAVFFAVKDATKSSLKNSALNGAPAWVTTTLAVSAALIPYWVIRNPSEVIKVRQQAGVPGYGDGSPHGMR